MGLIKKMMSLSVQGKAYISPEKRCRCYSFAAEITNSCFTFIDRKIIADFMVEKESGKFPFPVRFAMENPP